MSEEKCAPMTHLPRIFLALLFVVGGFGFAMNFAGTVGFVTMGLTPWGLDGMATVATIIAIVLKLGGGLMLLFNYRASTAAWMLIAFTVLATLLYHMQWSGDNGQMQMTAFLKNLALVGGLLLFTNCSCEGCKGSCKNDAAPAA